ncbi:MAG: lipopolysaccharide assembly protein LapB [Rubrivivax sp.]|nr:lipopolysaccharide assembly protein LapB [Rubrivivax sp.]
MEFDFQWLLMGLPIAFALGWIASRLDLRQIGRARRETPSAYFKGLNLLLNEQQDKAIDAFIEAVQHDPDTAELHFALGNLFRRRGEFERAVRVHEHLLARGDLKAHDRDRAQHALAQDFMKAGLIDRAEAAWRALEGTSFDLEARTAQLTLAERSRDWPRAVEVATRLNAGGGVVPGAFDARIAHYECEQALEADAAGRPQEAEAALARAHHAAPAAARPMLLAGQRLWKSGRAAEALAAWDELREQSASGAFLLVAEDYARAAVSCGRVPPVRRLLLALLAAHPATELLAALDLLEAAGPDDANGPAAPGMASGMASGIASGTAFGTAFGTASGTASPATQPAAGRHERWVAQLQRAPSLTAAQQVLASDPQAWSGAGLEALRAAVARAARPLQRYRCAACGFEAQHYFWQCPGCLSWESYPPQRIDALQ